MAPSRVDDARDRETTEYSSTLYRDVSPRVVYQVLSAVASFPCLFLEDQVVVTNRPFVRANLHSKIIRLSSAERNAVATVVRKEGSFEGPCELVL